MVKWSGIGVVRGGVEWEGVAVEGVIHVQCCHGQTRMSAWGT